MREERPPSLEISYDLPPFPCSAGGLDPAVSPLHVRGEPTELKERIES